MGADYQSLPTHNRHAMRHHNGPSKLTTYLLVALGISTLFFAYQNYVTALTRDAVQADLDHQMRKISELQQEKRELNIKNEELADEHNKNERAKSEVEKEITLRDAKIKELEQALDSARNSLSDTEAAKNGIETKLTESKTRIEQMENDSKAQIALLQSQLSDLQAEREIDKQELKRLQKEVEITSKTDASNINNALSNEAKASTIAPIVKPLQDFVHANEERQQQLGNNVEYSNNNQQFIAVEKNLPTPPNGEQQHLLHVHEEYTNKSTTTLSAAAFDKVIEVPNANIGNLLLPLVPGKRLEYPDGPQHNSGLDENKAEETGAQVANNNAKEEDRPANDARENVLDA